LERCWEETEVQEWDWALVQSMSPASLRRRQQAQGKDNLREETSSTD